MGEWGLVGGWVGKPNQNSKRQMEKSLVLISLQRTQKKGEKERKTQAETEREKCAQQRTHTERHTL